MSHINRSDRIAGRLAEKLNEDVDEKSSRMGRTRVWCPALCDVMWANRFCRLFSPSFSSDYYYLVGFFFVFIFVFLFCSIIKLERARARAPHSPHTFIFIIHFMSIAPAIKTRKKEEINVTLNMHMHYVSVRFDHLYCSKQVILFMSIKIELVQLEDFYVYATR